MAEDPLTVHARARVGRVLLGKWTLDRLIGVGGMAAVYEATHRNGSKVAIKMLHPTLMFDGDFAKRLVQEGYAANKINHPAAVKVHDDDKDDTDGAAFLVMELLEGETLSQLRRKRKRFSEIDTLKMMVPVLECLGNAHEKGIVHRDIKPENLFVNKDGAVRVLDFGIARISDGSSVTSTRTGMVVGSPAYMSPEQALGKMNAVGPQTDVYAVGATMFALLTGTTPHTGESTQEMMVMVAMRSARSITTVKPDIHPLVGALVDRSLAYNKEDRYPDAFAMLADVHAAIAEIELGATNRVLPTFADDGDEEGETRVKSAVGGPDRTPPPGPGFLPGAGLNRIGERPPTGAFPSLQASQAQQALTSPGRLRPPTLAPINGPLAQALAPVAPVAPMPATSSGVHPATPPTYSSGMHSAASQSGPYPFQKSPSGAFAAPQPVYASGQHMAPPIAPNDPGAQGAPHVPPTMAMPMMSLTGDGDPNAVQRPGATTNMAWAAPDAPPTGERSALPRSRKPLVIAAVISTVLICGGLAVKFATGEEPAPVHQPPIARRTPAPPVTPPPTPPTPEQNTPATPTPDNTVAANTTGTPSDPATPTGTTPTAPTTPTAETPTPNTPATPVENPNENNDTRSARRHGHDTTDTNNSNTTHERSPRRSRQRRQRTPDLGY
jgi:serine/threonine-protein kinase